MLHFSLHDPKNYCCETHTTQNFPQNLRTDWSQHSQKQNPKAKLRRVLFSWIAKKFYKNPWTDPENPESHAKNKYLLHGQVHA